MADSVPELSGLEVLTWVYPPDLVDRVIAACGRTEQRRRLLPARLVVYVVLGLALFSYGAVSEGPAPPHRGGAGSRRGGFLATAGQVLAISGA